MIDIATTGTGGCAQLREFLFAPHLRPRLRGPFSPEGNVFAPAQFPWSLYIIT